MMLRNTVPILLSISLLLLQFGVTSLFSFSSLATLILLLVFIVHFTIRLEDFTTLVILLFTISYVYTCFINPSELVERFSLLSRVASLIIAYCLLLVSTSTCKSFSSASYVVSIVTKVSEYSLLALNLLYLISELELFPPFNRNYFYSQNTSLIDNYSSEILVDNSLRLSALIDIRPDLLYGEPSFLGLILFVSAAILVFSLSIRNSYCHLFNHNTLLNKRYTVALISSSVFTLSTLKSLSSFFYAIIIVFFLARALFIRHSQIVHIVSILIIPVIFIIVPLLGLGDRFNLYESLSFSQRFLYLLDLPGIQFLLGSSSMQSDILNIGMHNGMGTIILLSGLMAFPYIYIVFTRFCTSCTLHYDFCKPLCLIVLFSIFMQNGAILSPSKLVILLLLRFSMPKLRLKPTALEPSSTYKPYVIS